MTIGKPSARSQSGELEAAREWVGAKYDSGWTGVPLYDAIFGLSNVDFSSLRLLDVGSGPISVFEPFAPENARVTAFDSLAAEYEGLIPGRKFPIRSSMPDQEFEIVALLNCLDHMDEPEALLAAACGRLAADGRLWVFANIDRPYEPELHPQDFKFWTLIAMMQRHLRIVDCGLVREGLIYPYAFWAICEPGRAGLSGLTAIWWNAKCGASYAWFHAVRAVVKLLRIAGLTNLLPKPLRG